MTDHAVFTTSPAHPVRWFVAAILAVAAVLVGAWWLGAANPRVNTTVAEAAVDLVHLEVRNDGPLPVRILDATPFGDEISGASLRAPVELSGSERSAAVIDVTVSCSSSYSGEPSGVRLRVRTWLGVHRDVDVTDPLVGRCR